MNARCDRVPCPNLKLVVPERTWSGPGLQDQSGAGPRGPGTDLERTWRIMVSFLRVNISRKMKTPPHFQLICLICHCQRREPQNVAEKFVSKPYCSQLSLSLCLKLDFRGGRGAWGSLGLWAPNPRAAKFGQKGLQASSQPN